MNKFLKIHAKALLRGAVEKKRYLTWKRTEYKLSSRKLPQIGEARTVQTKYGSYTTVFTPEWSERMNTLQRLDVERDVTKRTIRFLHLARGFLRGMPYKRIEAKTHNKPWPRSVYEAVREIDRHSDVTEAQIVAWLEGAVSVEKAA